MNKEHLKLLSDEEKENYVNTFIPESLKKLPNADKIISKMTPLIMERISKGQDIIDMANSGELVYFFGKPVYDRDSLFFKSSKIEEDNKYGILASYLKKAISILENIDTNNFTKENIKESIWPYADEVGRGDILWPIRYALSGCDKSPDPFTLAEVLGKEETVIRINNAILLLEKL